MERRQIVSLKHLSFIVFVAGVLVFVLFYIQFHPVHYFAHGSGCDVLCDEHVCVCVCVCLSVRGISPETTQAMFTKFWCTWPLAVARSFSGKGTKSQGEGTVLGVFFPTDNALCTIWNPYKNG